MSDVNLKKADCLVLEGSGGIDLSGEYIPNFNFYTMKISSDVTNLPFNLFVTVRRRISGGAKHSTIGWEYKLYISFFYATGSDILYKSCNVKSLKKVKESVFKDISDLSILNYKESLKSEIETYKNKNKKYIFTNLNDCFEYLGVLYTDITHYYKMLINQDRKLWLYEGEKMVDLTLNSLNNCRYFEVGESQYTSGSLFIREIFLNYNSYCTVGYSESSFKDKFGDDLLTNLKSVMLENKLSF